MIRALAVLCGALAAVAVIAAPASAKMKVTGKFDVSGVGTNNEITKGPDGNVWVTLDQTNDIARITPKGKVKEFDPANIDNPVGIASGPDKTLWVTQAGGVANSSTLTIPTRRRTSRSTTSPTREPIVKGPDGNMWTVSGART